MHRVWPTGSGHAARTGMRWCGNGFRSVLGKGREGCVAQRVRLLGGVVLIGRCGVCRNGGIWGNGNCGRRDDRPPARPGYTAGSADRRGSHGAAGAHTAPDAAARLDHSRSYADDGQKKYARQSINRHRKSRAGTANGAERDFFKPYGGGAAAGDAPAALAGRKRHGRNRPAAHHPVRNGIGRRRVLRHRDRQRGAQRGGKGRTRGGVSLAAASARRLRRNHRRQTDG